MEALGDFKRGEPVTRNFIAIVITQLKVSSF
jgi:hypothetical protein